MSNAWQEQVARIFGLKEELASIDAEAAPVSAPASPASKRAISAAERKMRRRLPRSYRTFLGEHDGWSSFFQGASLLGTDDLGKPRYAELARAAFEVYETPIPEIASRSDNDAIADSSRDFRADAMIPFGADADGQTIFAFNPAMVRPDGEMEVIAWIGSLGYRFDDFAEFLAMVADVVEAEIADRALTLKKSA